MATSASGELAKAAGPPTALKADPRYRVIGELGRGGMGVVFDAVDKQTGERVAIKVLSSRKEGLLRFKNEFRLASRLAHPNLVALYDLIITDDIAYFVMEHAPGVDLRRYVRDRARAMSGPTAADLPRLYSCLTQILEALECLGSAGIVHRDLKPSNVIVSDAGHVKLLDFGLAGAHDTPDFTAAMLAGTPTYMSPEQIAGQPLGPAADLYALGIMVYELCVGEPPFVGPQKQVLHAQRHAYPLPIRDRVEGVPEDFELWVLRLLAKKPEDRFPSARAARLALEACGAPTGKSEDWAEVGSGQYAALRDAELIGRDSERALLGALLDRVRDGACHMAVIQGESGIGKTALAEAILADAHQTGCVVLRGACREHESITYNAFDAVVDEAASALERLVARGMLKREQLADEAEDFGLLGRLFPVLRELHSGLHKGAPAGEPAPNDRERAFGLVKRLVERVTRTHPLVLLLDDLHWADEDSLALLQHLLGPPSARGLLVLATAWPNVDRESPVERFLRANRESPDGLITHLTLGPLGDFESAQIVETAAQTPIARRTVDAILREGQGNPFLLGELARLAVEDGLERPTVGDVARRRLALLDDDDKVMVELAAVAPAPVDAELLHHALEAFSRPLQLEGAGLRRLVGLKILRESGARTRSLKGVCYDFYHHRIRETIKAEIPSSRRKSIHLRLAEALFELRPDDPEALVRELVLGGDEVSAARHAERAAEAAMSRLAHARAVELFELSVKHASPEEAPRLRVRLAEALEGAARFAEAAPHFEAGLSANVLTGLRRIRIQLRLANCLMHVGKLERSGELVEASLTALGHPGGRPRLSRFLTVLWLIVRALVGGASQKKQLRKHDDEETQIRLLAYSLAVPHFQFTSRNVAQLEYALRYRLLGSRSPAAEVRQEANAVSLMLLIPFQHLPRVHARVERIFARLEEQHPKMASERGRAWLPLLKALYAMIQGRPDQAIGHFDELADYQFAKTGYVALQRHNALFLAGAYDRYVDDLVATTQHDGVALRPLDIARLAYIERVRGHRETARRLIEDIAKTRPEDVPWTHRSLYTYQLVELHMLDGDTAEAARLARSLVARVRRGAISPTTGAFESLDAVARAFLAEARRLERSGQNEAAAQLVRDAERALHQVPRICPPLFSGRLLHDRGIVALALGRRGDAVKLLDQAERASRPTVVPCFRMRLLEDLLEVYDPQDPRRASVQAELAELSSCGKLERRTTPAPWLWR